MSQDVVINGTTYPGVESISLQDSEGNTRMYFSNAVRYVPQTLTEAQKAQARENIGAVSPDEITDAVNDGLNDAKESGEFDYVLTEADKDEIAALVVEKLGGEPIFGFVDEDNNIIVQGNLADGTYNVKYEMDDGSTVDIGDLVLDSNVYYTVTNKLTNCTNSNNAVQAIGGQGYTATITANNGYELKSVSVTMGGSPVTVSGGVINIAKVTGNIVITAVAEEVVVEIVNLFDATSGDAGYGRLGSDGSIRTDAPNNFVTNYIAVKNGDVVRVSGCDVCTSYSMAGYDSTKAKVFSQMINSTQSYFTLDNLTDDYAQLTITSDTVKFLRFTCSNPNGSTNLVDTSVIIITKNQPIE